MGGLGVQKGGPADAGAGRGHWLTQTTAALACWGQTGAGRGSPALPIAQFICCFLPLRHTWVPPHGLQEPQGS